MHAVVAAMPALLGVLAANAAMPALSPGRHRAHPAMAERCTPCRTPRGPSCRIFSQGGRWLESSTVEHEGRRGYGAAHHHPQQGSPEVRCGTPFLDSNRWITTRMCWCCRAAAAICSCCCLQGCATWQLLLLVQRLPRLCRLTTHCPARPLLPPAQVQAALAGRKSPEFMEADEKLREARAEAQGALSRPSNLSGGGELACWYSFYFEIGSGRRGPSHRVT